MANRNEIIMNQNKIMSLAKYMREQNVARDTRWGKNIIDSAKLVPGLLHDWINHVEAGNFVLRSALLDEFFNTLHNMLVVLDSPDGSRCHGRHFWLGNWRLYLVQRRELENKKMVTGKIDRKSRRTSDLYLLIEKLDGLHGDGRSRQRRVA
jgi:hypothetical protein